MYNEALNCLKADVVAAPDEDGAYLRSIFDQHLERALQFVVTTDYVEDCLFQIDEAISQWCAEPNGAPAIRAYLLGAIEALRDELHLCDVEMNVRQSAVG
jgi:hypothetical protein